MSLLECIGKKNKVNMGNYVNSHLATEEHVVYEAHHHWCIWILPILGFVFFSIPCLGVIISIPSDELDGPMFLFLFSFGLFGIWGLIYTLIKTTTDEFAITNQRLIIKTGVISRRTFELNLTKVETIAVSQYIFDRIFNCGQISIRGTGSTICKLTCIAAPFDFRQAFQDVLASYYIPSNANDSYYKKSESTFCNGSSTESPNVSSNNNGSYGIVDKSESLMKIKELLDTGILTQEEFDDEKKKILNS